MTTLLGFVCFLYSALLILLSFAVGAWTAQEAYQKEIKEWIQRYERMKELYINAESCRPKH